MAMFETDTVLIDLLRRTGSLSVSEMSQELGVTANAVRQRVTRLMAAGDLERFETKSGRGRPGHRYQLTSKGHQNCGANFADLARVMWAEIQQIKDEKVRKKILEGIGIRLAELYEKEITGETTREKMNSIATLFGERLIPLSVESGKNHSVGSNDLKVASQEEGNMGTSQQDQDAQKSDEVNADEVNANALPLLRVYACPYPDLASTDETLCEMEQTVFSRLAGEELELNKCESDGGCCCTFEPKTNKEKILK